MTVALHETHGLPGAEGGGAKALPGDDGGASSWTTGVITVLRARLWLVAAVGAVFLVGAILYLRSADYTYSTELRIAPAPSATRESSSLGALTSLATLTGATLESIPVTPFRLYVEGVYTREVAARLARDPALMHQVFADEWDAGARQWREPSRPGQALRAGLFQMLGVPTARWTPPDSARLQGWIAAHVTLNQTPKTPIVTLGLAATDRDFGKAFLLRLHGTVDAWLRERTLERTRNNIAYLNQRLPTVTLADHRQALFVTLSDQQQREMTARNPAAFAAETFGNPTASPRPTSPRQLPILGIALVLGLITGAIAALVVPRRSVVAAA
jgi:hypothetical protein